MIHMVVVVIVTCQRGPDEFTIRECVLLHRPFPWYGINCVLHDSPPVRILSRGMPQHLSFVIVGTEV